MIDALANLHFLRPAWLLLAPVAIAVWWLWRCRTDDLRGWREQMDPELLKALSVGGKASQAREAHWALAVWLIATLAIAGPTWRLAPNPFASDAQPLMVLLKADQSMSAADPPPARLERAQLKIADLAAARRGQPMGLIAYAGSAHLVLPPTRDTGVVAEMAAEVRPDIMPVAGDRLDLAIQKAGELLQEEGEGGTLLVIADSVSADTARAAAAHNETGALPIQFLAIAGADAPKTDALRTAARALGARVVAPTVDDGDIQAIVSNAERRSAAHVGGEGDRWQDAGYWLAPLVALLAALSFRREDHARPEAPQ